jgi:hypothetical protein
MKANEPTWEYISASRVAVSLILYCKFKRESDTLLSTRKCCEDREEKLNGNSELKKATQKPLEIESPRKTALQPRKTDLSQKKVMHMDILCVSITNNRAGRNH